MNNKCGNTISKYVVVEPSSNGVFDGLTICGGSGLITDKINGCDDKLNINGNDYFNNGDVNFYNDVKVKVIKPNQNGGDVNFEGNFIFDGDIKPKIDNKIILGSDTKRFRDINTVRGTTTVWSVREELVTPKINLGEDNNGVNRVITADNSIIQDDTLLGGKY